MTDPTTSSDRWGLSDRRLYLCTPDRADLERFVDSCINGGVDIVQLREKHLPDDQLALRAELVQRVCAEHDVPFILNDRPALAAAIGADGVHVGQDDMPAADVRRIMGAAAIVGLSTHAHHELDTAVGSTPLGSTAVGHPVVDGADPAPVDYISAGPVVATPTKPGRPGTGLGYISEAVDRSPWSVWVTGGVDPTTVVDMIGSAARHFVVVRWLTEAADPEANARQLRRTIDELVQSAAR